MGASALGAPLRGVCLGSFELCASARPPPKIANVRRMFFALFLLLILLPIAAMVSRANTRRANRELAEMNAKGTLWAVRTCRAEALGLPPPPKPSFRRSTLGIVFWLAVFLIVASMIVAPHH